MQKAGYYKETKTKKQHKQNKERNKNLSQKNVHDFEIVVFLLYFVFL